MYPVPGICMSCVISPCYSATLCFRLSPSLVLGIGWPVSTLSNALLTPGFPSLFCSSVLLLFSLFYQCTKCCRKNIQILIPLPLPFLFPLQQTSVRVVYILFPVLPHSKPTLMPITPQIFHSSRGNQWHWHYRVLSATVVTVTTPPWNLPSPFRKSTLPWFSSYFTGHSFSWLCAPPVSSPLAYSTKALVPGPLLWMNS